MNSKKHTKFNCEYHFGISSLNNSSLVNRFYPEDLPIDWRFSYYSNEFELLLILLSDLNLSPSLIAKGNKVTADKIIEQLTELKEDIDESIVCLFDCSKLSLLIQQQLFASQIAIERNFNFINLDKLVENQVTGQSIQLEWINVIDKSGIEKTPAGNFFCYIKSGIKIEPVELRALIEHIRDYAQANNGRTMSIVFSSDYALENCRNAILLERMM